MEGLCHISDLKCSAWRYNSEKSAPPLDSSCHTLSGNFFLYFTRVSCLTGAAFLKVSVVDAYDAVQKFKRSVFFSFSADFFFHSSIYVNSLNNNSQIAIIKKTKQNMKSTHTQLICFLLLLSIVNFLS